MIHLSHMPLFSVKKRPIRLLASLFILALLTAPSLRADDDEEDPESKIGALRITSETDANSAQYNINQKAGKNEPTDEDDKKRKVIGIGETITLTACGKPLGKVEELTWEITSGEDSVKIGIPRNQSSGNPNSSGLRGKKLILIAKKSLKEETKVKVTYKTSEGNSPEESFEFKILVPTGMEVEHLDGGTPTDNGTCIRHNENGTGLFPSAMLKVTLQPLSVNFGEIEIVERNVGSEPEGCSLDEGHEGNGVDEPAPVNEHNAYADRMSGGIIYNQLKERGGRHQLPQSWVWTSTWHAHNCEETGCTGTDPIDPGSQEPGGLPPSSVSHSNIGDTVKYGESKMNHSYSYITDDQGLKKVHVQISKFGVTVSRTEGESQNTYD